MLPEPGQDQFCTADPVLWRPGASQLVVLAGKPVHDRVAAKEQQRDPCAGVSEFIMKVMVWSNLLVKRAALGTLLLTAVGLPSARTQETAQQVAHHGIVVANMNRSIRPGDDFYDYANGGWIQRTKLPGDRAVYGVFSVLADVADKRVAD